MNDAQRLERAWDDAANSRVDEALAVATPIGEHAEQSGDHATAALAALMCGLACANGGRFEDAAGHVDRLMVFVERAPDPLLSGYGWILRALLALSRADVDDALEHVVRAEAAALEVTDRPDKRARLLGNIAATYSTSEHYEDAERVIVTLLDLAQQGRYGYGMYRFRRGRNLVLWAMRHEHCGQLTEAAELFDRGAAAYASALAAVPDDRFATERSVACSARMLAVSRASLLRREAPDLSGCAPGAAEDAETTVWALYARASAALATGRPRDALALMAEVEGRDWATVLGVPPAEAPYLRALAHTALGDAGAALAAYRDLHHADSRKAYEQRQRRLESARARMERAELAVAAHRYATESMTDALTGLPNRRHLDTVLAALDGRTDRPDVTIAVLDLDRFKQINDCHGHLVGDAVLARAARALRDTLRAGDMVARYGGDEFVVVAVGLPASGAAGLADRLADAVAGAGWADVGAVTITCGVACAEGGESPRSVLARADGALIARKTARRAAGAS